MTAYMAITTGSLALSVACVVLASALPNVLAHNGWAVCRTVTVRLALLCAAMALCFAPDVLIGLLRSQDVDLRRNGLGQALRLYWDAIRPDWLSALF